MDVGFEIGKVPLQDGNIGLCGVFAEWPMAAAMASACERSTPAVSRARAAPKVSKKGEVMQRIPRSPIAKSARRDFCRRNAGKADKARLEAMKSVSWT